MALIDGDKPILQGNHLSLDIGGNKILKEISFSFTPGIIGLLGPNGAGKSTLIKLILGVLKPSKGEIIVNGLVNGNGCDPLAHIGFMPEARAFHPGMKGVDYVLFAGEIQGMTHEDARRRANEALDCLGVGESRFRTMGQYSAGMIQKTKLAQALVHDPSLLILDEPTAGLDPPSREEMLDLLNVLGTTHGKSILISTHLLGDVERTCNQVIVLDNGECLFSGKMSELLISAKNLFQVIYCGELDTLSASIQFGNWDFIPGDEPGTGVLRLSQENDQALFFHTIHKAGGWIKKFVPLEPRLDEVFFDLIQKHGLGK